MTIIDPQILGQIGKQHKPIPDCTYTDLLCSICLFLVRKSPLSKIMFKFRIITAILWNVPIFEPPHDKTNKIARAPSEDSDQPGHPPSLIRVFAVRTKKACVLSYPLSAQQRLIRLSGCPGWSESSLGAQSFCWFCQRRLIWNCLQ